MLPHLRPEEIPNLLHGASGTPDPCQLALSVQTRDRHSTTRYVR